MSPEPPDDEHLLETVRDDPTSVEVDAIVKLLDHDMGTFRNIGLMALSTIAMEEPDRVVEHSDEVIDHLDDEFPVAQSTALQVLSRLGSEYPEAVRPAIPRLVELLDQMPPLTGYRAGRAIAPLLEHYPEDFVQHVDELLAIASDPPDDGVPTQADLDEMDPDIREKVMDQLSSRGDEVEHDVQRVYGIREMTLHTLVEVSDVEPEALVGRLTELRPSFETEPPIVRGAATDVVANVAKHDSSAVEPVVEDLIEIATTDMRAARVHAIQALGFAEAPEAIEPLREVAESDDEAVSPEVSDLATETADFIDAQH
ncbi:hypothetical protein [Salinarchaeum laminariae]|uniref:hypothetical protein n=1 Tax=Salinarchaeum laminariae TaxID=869888 RepID=UPI0020BE6D2D|nr:hypothetical protein [Salinarchaeum laminariae]